MALAEYPMHGLGLGQVVLSRRGAVGVDVPDLRRLAAGVTERGGQLNHAPGRTNA